MEIIIEGVKEEDIQNVIDLANVTKELWDNDEPEYFSKDELMPLLQSDDDLFLKATVDGEFVGFTMITFHKFLKEAYFMDMAVKKEFRDLGVAHKLFEYVDRALKERNCKFSWALVHEENNPMMEILQKKGFKKGRKFVVFNRGY